MNSVEFELQDAYGICTFLEQGKFNPDTLKAFNEILSRVSDPDEGIDALILTGTEKNFSQGLDLEAMSKMQGDDAQNFVDQCMHAISRLLVLPVPSVAAVNGHAFGLGAMISLACDYSVMREDKGFFCLPEIDIKMNLIPSMNALVCHKLKGRVLRDVLLTGERCGGVRAEELGIVDSSTSEGKLLNVARKLAEPMKGKDRRVLMQLKTGIYKDLIPQLEIAE